MEKMDEAIDEIRKAMTETARIVKAIGEVTEQAKRLPLNETDETVGASEAPPDTSAPADDARTPAMEAAQAVRNTSALMEEATKNAQEGMAIAAEVARILEEITAAATKANALAAEIAAATRKIEPTEQEFDDTG
ncbi:MAG TPA: hypothetical protein VM223_06815 [Planctomycetota bacterium]|nr:hypothetical protein [Planctomycetota bacterium]